MGKVVIVGGGQAGYAAASRLRELSYEGSITLVGDEPQLPYQRPPLSKAYLLGKMSADRLEFRPREFYDVKGITLRTSVRVNAINRDRRLVVLDGGEELPFDKLILATGSRARQLSDDAGMALSNVHVIRTIADSDAMRAELQPGKRVFIVGAGYVGLEVASACSSYGLKVNLIEVTDRILQRVAARETSARLAELHKGYGVCIRTGTGLRRLEGQNGRLTRALLTDMSVVEADIAVLGIGAVPNTELAVAAGLAIDNGIAVDEFCRTSDPEILAAGDCANFPFHGERVRLESVQNAIDQAQVAAATAAGATKRYNPVPWFWSDQYNVKLQTVGLNHGHDEVLEVSGEREDSRSIWYFRAGRALAVDSINDSKTHMAVRRLFEAGKGVTLEELKRPGFDLMALMKGQLSIP